MRCNVSPSPGHQHLLPLPGESKDVWGITGANIDIISGILVKLSAPKREQITKLVVRRAQSVSRTCLSLKLSGPWEWWLGLFQESRKRI